MKTAYSTQYDVINLWITKAREEARLKKRYGEVGLFFKGDYIYSGSSWPWCSPDYHNQETILAKRITDDIYFMSKYKYRWCDCIKVPFIRTVLRRNKKKIYFIEDFEDIEANIKSYRNSIDRLEKKLMRTRKYPHIYHKMLKNKIQEYNSYIKDFKLKQCKRHENALDNKVAIRIVSLKLRGLYDNEHQWQGYWINKHWED